MQKTVEQQFFSHQNEVQLFNTLAQEFQQKQGGLTERQQNRLGKTLEHYMREVWDTNGPMPITQLNREALGASVKDFNGYLRRDNVMPSVNVSQTIVSDPRNQPQLEIASTRLAIQQGVQPRPTFDQSLLQDTGSRFEIIQQERTTNKESRPQVPDFQVSLTASADEPSALSLYENAKKSREQEAARVSAIITNTQTDVNPLARFMSPPSIQNDPNTNSTLALPVTPAPRGPLQQDYIIKHDDVISYKEIEHNLFLYSADRDWVNNTRENRYSFSVNFDPANNQQGFNFNTSVTKKFRNISRIELIKVILPTEGLETLVKNTDISSKINALSYPYVIVRIPELDTNNFGTDNNLDNAFGVIQYDANWYTDTANITDGYLGMIPKFMKCQKVYHPTPLATLTKLTVELQTPDGSPLSALADSLVIRDISIGGTLGTGITSAIYGANTGYLFIRTTTFFSQWTFSVGNRIQFQGLDASQLGGSTAAVDLVNYLQSNKLLISAIANTGPGTAADGANSVGYANVIIVRCPYVDPTTGSATIKFFGGAASNATLGAAIRNTILTTGALINLTHQTNIVLRVITREIDPTARVRPDNL